MNKVILKGRLTRDPEVRTTQSGKLVARFSLAVDRRGKDAGADFPSCIAWEKTAELADKYLHKGKEILVEGSISTRSYESNGEKKYVTEVNVYTIEFCGKKEDGGSGSSGAGSAANGDYYIAPNAKYASDDDIPF